MNYARTYPRVWLAYFVVSLVGNGFGALCEIVRGVTGRSSTQALFGAAFGLLVMYPLYGYVRQLRVGKRWMWIALWAVCSLALVLAAGAVLFVSAKGGLNLPQLALFAIMGTAVPCVFALYQYSFNSRHIWQHGA